MRRLVVLGLIVMAAACEGAGRPGSATPTATTPTHASSDDDARDRLTALATAWFGTSATVIYRTTAPVPGQPATAHLCLRQMFDHDFGQDRTDLLRRCSRQGHLRLTWDPPHRWRMDITSPVDAYSIGSTDEGGFLCRDPGAVGRCRSISSRIAIRSSPFGFLFMRPNRLVREIGASGVSVSSSAIEADRVGGVAECFAADGNGTWVVWCYSTGGILVSMMMGSSERGWTRIEAESISGSVDEGRFEVAT
jgi:hypothetical protein